MQILGSALMVLFNMTVRACKSDITSTKGIIGKTTGEGNYKHLVPNQPYIFLFRAQTARQLKLSLHHYCCVVGDVEWKIEDGKKTCGVGGVAWHLILGEIILFYIERYEVSHHVILQRFRSSPLYSRLSGDRLQRIGRRPEMTTAYATIATSFISYKLQR